MSERRLLKEGGLLLLDGLDEVPQAKSRRAQIIQAVDDFAATFGNCRILVTTRTYPYQKQDWKLHDLPKASSRHSATPRFAPLWIAGTGMSGLSGIGKAMKRPATPNC